MSLFKVPTPMKLEPLGSSASISLSLSDPILIGYYKPYDIRIIETLIFLQSSHWLNLDDIIERPNASSILVNSVNASMALTQELPKCVLNNYT